MRKYDFVKFGIEKGHLKKTAFELHQTAESLYHCVLLVVTFYTPHVHNRGFLRTQAERLDRRLVDTWPRERKADRTLFEKLKEADVVRPQPWGLMRLSAPKPHAMHGQSGPIG